MDDPISKEKLCKWSGLSDRRHLQLVKEGKLPRPVENGKWPAEPTVEAFFKYHREQIAKKSDDLKKEQEKLTKAKRQIAEEELAIIQDKYVLKDEIAPALRNISLNQRAFLQRALEQDLPDRLIGKDVHEMRREMARAVDAICAVFRDGTKRWAEAPPK